MLLKQSFIAARDAGVPIFAVETSDPANAVATITSALNGKATEMPLIAWDAIRTLRGLNVPGMNTVGTLSGGNPPESVFADPAQTLGALTKLPDGSKVFFYGAQLFIRSEHVRQGIWNLRDDFKSRRCMLVLLCDAITLPPELVNDVMIVNDPLPTPEELRALVKSVVADANNSGAKIKLSAEDADRIADVLTGLSSFAAEQQLAVSLECNKVNMETLWDRKIKTIEQTGGLSVWRGTATFDAIGGNAHVQSFLTKIVNGKSAPKVIGFIDEIEKSFAASGTDTSGVTQDQVSCFLRYMQDKGTPGIILIGPPGTGKSEIAKAAGRSAPTPIPTISVDLGGMKGSLVGESEQKIRKALDVVDAVGQGKVIWIATCNSIGALPPELRRRFYLGTFFVDLPDASERKAIWKLYLKKYDLGAQEIPEDEDWTGAEIKACCDKAWRMGCTLKGAAMTIVPVAVSAKDAIDRLRSSASGCYISASKPGPFILQPKEPKAPDANKGRKMQFAS